MFLKTLAAEKKAEPEDDEAAATLKDLSMLAAVKPAFVAMRTRGWRACDQARTRGTRRGAATGQELLRLSCKSTSNPNRKSRAMLDLDTNRELPLGQRGPQHPGDRPAPEAIARGGAHGFA